jgi:hypothetical protein
LTATRPNVSPVRTAIKSNYRQSTISKGELD